MNMNTPTPPLPNDDALERLLDEALAPPAPPAGLSQRIIEATHQHLPQRRVLARLAWRHAAAAAALAACVTLLVALWPATTTTTAPHRPDTLATMDWQSEFAAVQYAVLDSEIDREIALLRWDIEFAMVEELTATDWSDDGLLWQWESDAADTVF